MCSNSNNPVANKISFVTFGPGHFEYDWNGEKDVSNFPQRVAKEMASKVVTLFIHFELPSGNLNADHIGKQVQRKSKAKKRPSAMSSTDASEAVTMTKFTLMQVNLSPAAAQAPMSLQWIGQDKRLQMMLIMLLAKVFSVCFFFTHGMSD